MKDYDSNVSGIDLRLIQPVVFTPAKWLEAVWGIGYRASLLLTS